MRHTFAVVACAALLIFTGCDKGTPGGPGATNNKSTNSKIPSLKQGEDTFSLTVPTLSTTLKQGENKVVSLGIKRGKNFDEDVMLKFENLPKGMTIDPSAPTIKHGDTEVNVTIKAASDAAVGDFTIEVKGHPEKGPDATQKLKVTVKSK
ncbi:MAG TPA: hypothetical protein VMF69_12570 [Gemmataceae bacterium]|nr:hypothetical protein [Gemmataceae bacterium]